MSRKQLENALNTFNNLIQKREESLLSDDKVKKVAMASAVSDSDDDSRGSCPSCGSLVEEGICCIICKNWYHFEERCAGRGLSGKKNKNVIENSNLHFVCTSCDPILPYLKKLDPTNKDSVMMVLKLILEEMMMRSQDSFRSEIHSMLQANFDQITKMVDTKLENKATGLPTNNLQSYAEKVKTKNVLVVKSTQDDDKAANKKKAIMQEIKTPVDNVKTTKDGHLVVNFANKKNLEEAKRQLEDSSDQHSVTVNKKNKLKPKIKVVKD